LGLIGGCIRRVCGSRCSHNNIGRMMTKKVSSRVSTGGDGKPRAWKKNGGRKGGRLLEEVAGEESAQLASKGK